MRVLLSAAILPVALAAAPGGSRTAQGDRTGDPWRLVHPEARWILGVDWARARNSQAALVLSRQFEGARSKVESSGLGVSAIVSLDRILASGISLEASGAEAPRGMIVAFEGKMDRSRLKKELPPGTAVEKFRGADLFVPPKVNPREPLLALVSDSLMLMGDRESLGLILSGGGGPRNAELFGRAARVAATSEIWMVAAAGEPGASSAAAGDPFRDLRQLEFSVTLRDGLRLVAALAAENPQAAQHMAGLLQLAGVAGAQNESSSWLRRLRAELKGEELALELDIPARELEQAIESGKAFALLAGQQALEAWLGADAGPLPEGIRPAVRASGTKIAGVGALALPAAPPEPQVRTIRIVGAEDGPKEIQYSAPRPGQ